MDSILNTVKVALGVEENYNGFDTQILLSVNDAISNLNQLGIGPSGGFIVISENETWNDLLGQYVYIFESAKSYILQKVRLSFDPPSNSFLVDAINKQIAELEWRLMVQAETPTIVNESVLLNKKSLLTTPVYEPGQETWFLQDGLFLADCVGAYAPAIALNYEASKVNLANPGVHDCYAPQNPPTWESNVGWKFEPTSSQYLRPSMNPSSQWSVICNYRDTLATPDDSVLFGALHAGSRLLYYKPKINMGVYGEIGAQKSFKSNLGPSSGGYVAISGDGNCYLSGTNHYLILLYTAPVDSWDSYVDLDLYFGCADLYGDSPYYFIRGSIRSIAVYNKPLTLNQCQLIAAAMP